jgi:hypothetical protein
VLAVHNLADEPCVVQLRGCEPGSALDDLLGLSEASITSNGRCEADLRIEGHGFRWFRIVPPGGTATP